MDLYNGAYINESGKIVFCSQFSMVYDFSDGVACVVDKVNGKAGVIDMQGKYIIEASKYNSLRPCKGGLFETKDDNQKIISSILIKMAKKFYHIKNAYDNSIEVS